MKKIVAILLVLLLAVGLAACNKEDAPDGMKNAAADNAKFFLYVPDSWIAQNEISAATSPSADGSNVNVTVYLMDEAYTVQTYWENKAAPELANTFKDFTLLTEQCAETTLGGIGAQRYVYTASLGGSVYQFMQYIVINGNMVYTLTYTAKTEHFATHLEDVEEMRVNFAFK